MRCVQAARIPRRSSRRTAASKYNKSSPRARRPRLGAEEHGEIRLARELVAHVRDCPHLRHAEALLELDEVDAHDEGVARHDRAAEAAAIDAAEEELVLRAADVVVEHDEPANLRSENKSQRRGQTGMVPVSRVMRARARFT